MTFYPPFPVPPFSIADYPMMPVTASTAEEWACGLWRTHTNPRSDLKSIQGNFRSGEQCMYSTDPGLQAVIVYRPLAVVNTVSYVCVSGLGAQYVDVAVYPPTLDQKVNYWGWNGSEFVPEPAKPIINMNGDKFYWYRLEIVWDGNYDSAANATVFYAKTYRFDEKGDHPPFKLWAFSYLPEWDAPSKLYDGAARNRLLESLKRPLLKNSADPTPTTGETTIGVIVVDYADARATETRAVPIWDLLEPAKVSDWFENESNGKFNHAFEVHPDVVHLPKNAQDYKDKTNDVADDIDVLLDIPDHWNMVVICSVNMSQLRDLFVSQRTTCTFDETVTAGATTGGEVRPTVFIDQSVYGEADNRGWSVVVHEILHGLGLIDLYGKNSRPIRSFGWSIMGDNRTAWHLLGWEKLMLGWLSMDDFVFVESGIVEVEIVQQNMPGKKGVVVLDNAGNGAYFFEWSQDTGKTPGDRDYLYRNLHRSPNGLLAYFVNFAYQQSPALYDRSPPVTLYPYKRGDRYAGYGGAPMAAYPANPSSFYSCGRNEVVADIAPSAGGTAGSKIKIQVGKNPGYTPKSYRFVSVMGEKPVLLLGIDEYLVSTDGRWSVRFENDGSLYAYKGDVSKSGTHYMVARFGPSVAAVSEHEKFEFYLGLDRKGIVSCNYGTGSDDYFEGLLSANAPNYAAVFGNANPDNIYIGRAFLAIETGVDQLPALRLYSGFTPTDSGKIFLVEINWTERYLQTTPVKEFRRRKYAESAGGEFKLILQDDQYLTLRDSQDGFVWHLDHTGARVSIDEDGFVEVWSDNGDRTWRYDGTFVNEVNAAEPKEFSFRVGSTGSVEVVQGRDAAAVVLYKLRG